MAQGEALIGELKKALKAHGLTYAEVANSDEAKALACLHQRKLCQEQIEQLEHAIQQHHDIGEKLLRDIGASEQRFTQLQQKHKLMRARQSTSDALNATAHHEDHSVNLDDAFDRWEIKISQHEVLSNPDDLCTSLEQEFISQETQNDLRLELATLLAKENNHDH